MTLAEYSGDECNNSEVIRSIIAIAANHKLMSDNDNGKYMGIVNSARSGTELPGLSHLETAFVFGL
jgi:hypothetical protein